MVARMLESAGVSPSRSRVYTLILALVLLAGVMALEWVHQLEYSLGVLYVVPVVVAATVLNWWQTILVALFAAFARGQFTQGLTPIEFSLRFAMAVLAYGGVGTLVSEMNRNRRAILAA